MPACAHSTQAKTGAGTQPCARGRRAAARGGQRTWAVLHLCVRGWYACQHTVATAHRRAKKQTPGCHRTDALAARCATHTSRAAASATSSGSRHPAASGGRRPLPPPHTPPTHTQQPQHQHRPTTHHDPQLPVSLRALPRGHQVQHVHALVRLAVLLAVLAHQLDAARREEGAPGRGVDHLDEPLCMHAVTSVSQTICSFGRIEHALINGMDKLACSFG